MDRDTLEKLQNVEFEILCMIDAFCQKHSIRYSLYAGTAIGAVRHKGFIPWDDDIDICMTRENFNRFCTAWHSEPVEGYTLSDLLFDDMCATCHAKMHKDNTVLLSDGDIEEIGHHGIWVDIFPLDKAGDEANQKQVFRRAKELIVLTRANTANRNDTFAKKVIRRAISLIPKKIRRKRILQILKWLADNDAALGEDSRIVSLSATYAFRYRLPAHIPESVTKIEFNDRLFDIYSAYDEMLRILYGDYMKLPPESKRVCTHSPVKLIF